jgi:hypothetical protein
MKNMGIIGHLAVENRILDMDLSMYDGKRIAVVLTRGGVQRVLCGLAAYEKDDDLGAIVRIRLQDKGSDLPGRPAIILQDDAPNKCMVADDRYGYDFRLNLGAC